jgi:hypothetical protein
MNQMACIYPDRDDTLVAYLYDDIDAAERVAFETHVATCPPCRSEIAELRTVRARLAQWATPDTAPGTSSHQSSVTSLQSWKERRGWWHSVPVWAQVAAAMLVLGVSASIANLDIRYDRNGLNVRTGWSKALPAAAQAVQNDAPWRAELTAMQTQLQSALRAQQTTAAAASTAPAASATDSAISDADVQRRVRVMLDASEKKQEQSLALHLIQLQKDFDAQRQADIRRTNQLFREVMSTYNNEMVKQQRQINYLLPGSQGR